MSATRPARAVDSAPSRLSREDPQPKEPSMIPKIDVITIGVADLTRAREFYEQGLGRAVREEGNATLGLRLGGNASRLALRQWEAVAFDAGVEPESTGFRGFTLSYILDSAD